MNESNIVDLLLAGNFRLKIVVTVAIATMSSNEDAPNINVVMPFFLPYFCALRSIMPGTMTAGLHVAMISPTVSPNNKS